MVRIRGMLVSLLVLASACTTSDTAPTTSVGASPTTTAAATTTVGPETTTTAAAPAPASTAAPDQVGSREVMLQEMRAAWEANQFTYDWPFEDAYIPDLQNPDPLVALEELIVFADWLAMNGGNDLWWDVITVQDSPAYSFWRSALSTFPGRVFAESEGGTPFFVSELRIAAEDEQAVVQDAMRALLSKRGSAMEAG